MKKIIIFVMAFLIAFSGFPVSNVQAAELIRFYSSPSEELEKAKEAQAIEYLFDVDVRCQTRIAIVATKQSDIRIVVHNAENQLITDKMLVGSSGCFEESWSMYKYFCELELEQGKDYKLEITFSQDDEFSMVIGRTVVREMPSIKIAKGVSSKLDTHLYEVASWECSNKKIATVQNGKVVGKKTGTATITATIKEDMKLSWKVKVVDNVYKETQIKVSSKPNKKRYMQVYKAYYSGKKLVIKARIVNNTKVNYTELRKLKLVVKTENGKTIGSYENSKKNVNIPKRSAKDLTFVIKKPKMANVDLRGAKVSIKGTLFHYK